MFSFSVLGQQNLWITTHSSYSWKIIHYLEKGFKIPQTPQTSTSEPPGRWHQGGRPLLSHCFLVLEEQTHGISQQFLKFHPHWA